MEYFTIITLHAGSQSASFTMTVTAPPGATRASLYEHARNVAIQRAGLDFGKATVMFFSAEPNTLVPASQ